MKKLLLTLLLITASMHAMNADLKIVDFDYEKHHASALKVFMKALPGYNVPYVLKEKSNVVKNQQFEVLTGPDETVIGLIIHCLQGSAYHHYFADFFKNGHSQVFITRDALKICTLQWLCIDPEHQEKRYGEFMINHLEAHARKEHCDLIDLSPLNNSMKFYKKFKYSPRFLTNNIMIAKGLNPDARAVLAAIAREHAIQ